jgi:dUTPase
MSNLLLQPSSALVAELYANSPTSVTENAGYDLFVPEEVVFAAGEKKQVSMGVRVVVEEGGNCLSLRLSSVTQDSVSAGLSEGAL